MIHFSDNLHHSYVTFVIKRFTEYFNPRTIKSSIILQYSGISVTSVILIITLTKSKGNEDQNVRELNDWIPQSWQKLQIVCFSATNAFYCQTNFQLQHKLKRT